MPDEALKNFGSRRFVRKVRAEIEAETAGMSPEQVVAYYRNYRYERPHPKTDATRLSWWENGKEGGDRASGDRNFNCIAYVRWVRAKFAQGTGRQA